MTDLSDFELSKRKLSNGWRVGEPYSVSKRNEEEFQAIVAQLKAIPREKPKPTTEQSATTQALLDAQKLRPESADAAYAMEKRLAALPEEAQVRNADGSINLGTRSIVDEDGMPIADVMILTSLKHGRYTIGQSTESSVSPEKRERAIHAFTYSKPYEPSNKELLRLTKIGQLEAVVASEPAQENKQRITWWDRVRWALFSFEGESLESFVGRKE